MRFPSLVFFTVAITATQIKAQGFQWGFQGGTNSAQGDIRRNLHLTTGYSLGANCQFDLKNGHALIPRIEFTTFGSDNFITGTVSSVPPTSPPTFYPIFAKAKLTSTALIFDYSYSLSGQTNVGAYLILGGGSSRVHYTFDMIWNPSTQFHRVLEGSKSTMITEAGFGYMVSAHLGMEVRYDVSKYGDDNQSANAKWFNFSVIGRF